LTLDYAAHCIQAKMIDGDYYDFLDMGTAEVGIVLADIAGKGIPVRPADGELARKIARAVQR
jgi:serine phosphatase RsbU (regulator of sigma subunit)